MRFSRGFAVFGRRMHSQYLAIIIACGLLLVFFTYFKSEIARLDQKTFDESQSGGQLRRSVHEYNQDGSPSEEDDIVLIYNRVPKTGSTSFAGIAYELCTRNKFNVLHFNITRNNHVLSIADQIKFAINVTKWDAKKPALYHGHLAYVEFSKFGITKKPVYINIIRNPLERLISYYYFLRHGDDFRPHLKRRRAGNKQSFDECVAMDGRDCDPENMWLQIPFFCGHAAECWNSGSRWALELAKYNLVNNYLVVGVTEELGEFIAVMEATLPRFFAGATEMFNTGSKSHLRKTFNKIPPLPDTMTKIKESDVWQMENEFYEFARDHFHFVKRKLFEVKDGFLQQRQKQFMYEKIRPR